MTRFNFTYVRTYHYRRGVPTTAAPRTAVPRQLRLARLAVSALFLTNGAMIANLIPRYPGIKADLGLTNAAYGLTVAALPAGAIVAGLGAAAVIRRLGSARAAVFTTIATAVFTMLAGLSPSVVTLALALFFAGAADSVTDVAQNRHGLRVQHRYGRSIINSLHALWSLGAVIGGSIAAATIALGISRGMHLAITAVVFSAVALTALRYCLPGPDEDTADEPSTAGAGLVRVARGTVLTLVPLVVIATAGTLVEDAGSTWAAVYLNGSLGAAPAVAAYGFIALVGAQFVGRMLGDRMVDRFGERAVARAGGAIAAVGMGVALAFPSLVGTIAGFAAAGFGVATLVPAAMHAADNLPGLRTGTGLTVVSWLMRLGFLLSPPIVGLVADTTSLRVGLLVVPLAGLAALALAGVLAGRRSSNPAPEPTALATSTPGGHA